MTITEERIPLGDIGTLLSACKKTDPVQREWVPVSDKRWIGRPISPFEQREDLEYLAGLELQSESYPELVPVRDQVYLEIASKYNPNDPQKWIDDNKVLLEETKLLIKNNGDAYLRPEQQLKADETALEIVLAEPDFNPPKVA